MQVRALAGLATATPLARFPRSPPQKSSCRGAPALAGRRALFAACAAARQPRKVRRGKPRKAIVTSIEATEEIRTGLTAVQGEFRWART